MVIDSIYINPAHDWQEETDLVYDNASLVQEAKENTGSPVINDHLGNYGMPYAIIFHNKGTRPFSIHKLNVKHSEIPRPEPNYGL